MESLDFDNEERRILRLRRAMEDLVASAAWKEYIAVIESQIKVRENAILNEPAAQQGAPLDPLGRLLGLETIKGALMGLKLALATPHTIIAEAKEILAARKGDEGDDE